MVRDKFRFCLKYIITAKIRWNRAKRRVVQFSTDHVDQILELRGSNFNHFKHIGRPTNCTSMPKSKVLLIGVVFYMAVSSISDYVVKMKIFNLIPHVNMTLAKQSVCSL